MTTTTPKNGTILKSVVGSLIAAVLLMAVTGYYSIASRLDKIEQKMDTVVEVKTKVKMLEDEATENHTLILNHIAAVPSSVSIVKP